METEELNCPRKLGQEPRKVQGQRQAEQGWSIREVDTGGHPWKGLQSGGLEHPLTFTYFMPFKKNSKWIMNLNVKNKTKKILR